MTKSLGGNKCNLYLYAIKVFFHRCLQQWKLKTYRIIMPYWIFNFLKITFCAIHLSLIIIFKLEVSNFRDP